MIQHTTLGMGALNFLPLTSDDRGDPHVLKEAVAPLPQMFIIKVAPKDHVLASSRAHGEEHFHEVFIVGVTVSNLNIYGSYVKIT
jgi:hypothetical protein